MNSPENISPPPCDANVAGSDSGESPTTNKACPEPTSKLDDSGRGGFIVEEGGYYRDGLGRKRGPAKIIDDQEQPILITDEFGSNRFDIDGCWLGLSEKSEVDLIAPWIDWKAECERKDVALRAIKKGITNILKTRWGYDGDCGVDDIATELEDICDNAVASLKGEGAGA